MRRTGCSSIGAITPLNILDFSGHIGQRSVSGDAAVGDADHQRLFLRAALPWEQEAAQIGYIADREADTEKLVLPSGGMERKQVQGRDWAI